MPLLYAARSDCMIRMQVCPCGLALWRIAGASPVALLYAARSDCMSGLAWWRIAGAFPVALLYTARSGCMILMQVCSCGLSVWAQFGCILFTL